MAKRLKCPGSVALNTKRHARTHARISASLNQAQANGVHIDAMRLSEIRYISSTQYKELDGERASDDYLRLSSRSLLRCLASSTRQTGGTGSVSPLLRREKGSGSHPHVRRDKRRGADAAAALVLAAGLASASPAPAPGSLDPSAGSAPRRRRDSAGAGAAAAALILISMGHKAAPILA